MSDLTPFVFESKTIRVIIDDEGEPWFIAKDVAEALGYTDTRLLSKLSYPTRNCKFLQLN